MRGRHAFLSPRRRLRESPSRSVVAAPPAGGTVTVDGATVTVDAVAVTVT